MIKMVYLIQCEHNGYVHCVFHALRQAQLWIRLYEHRTDENRIRYIIVERAVYDSPFDI